LRNLGVRVFAMRLPRRFLVATVVAATLSVTGCASIMSGRHAEVAINTNAPNARVVVRDKRGQHVASLHTPATVTLRRKDRFIMPARYTATIEAPGYQQASVPIRSTINPWILGNVVIGGIPGLVVDNFTGAAWRPRDSEIYQELTPIYGAGPLYSAEPRPVNTTVQAASYSNVSNESGGQ
jgi:uncharacterized protein YceK